MYIIIIDAGYGTPIVHTDRNGLIKNYCCYENAKKEAEEISSDNNRAKSYFDYQIYQEAKD